MGEHDKDKNGRGRKYDQITQDGTTSAAGMGSDATGDIGAMPRTGEDGQVGSRQADTRTDDLLTSGDDAERSGRPFGTGDAGELQTGMGGIGSLSSGDRGSRQGATQPGGSGNAMHGSQVSQGAASTPESGGQRIEDGKSGQSPDAGGQPGRTKREER